MNWLDLVLIIVIAWFTVTAFFTGLIREIVTIATAILGVVLAGVYYNELADRLQPTIENTRLAHIVAFGIIFGIVAIAGHIVAYAMRLTAMILMLGWLDSIGGALAGFVKGSIIVEIFLIVVTTYPYFGLEDTIRGSSVAAFYLELVPVLVGLLPQEFRDAVERFPEIGPLP